MEHTPTATVHIKAARDGVRGNGERPATLQNLRIIVACFGRDALSGGAVGPSGCTRIAPSVEGVVTTANQCHIADLAFSVELVIKVHAAGSAPMRPVRGAQRGEVIAVRTGGLCEALQAA